MLDLDALERVVQEMTPGEWTVSPLRVLGLWSVHTHDEDEPEIDAGRHNDILGIVALRNAAESLIGELRLVRAVVEAVDGAIGDCIYKAIGDGGETTDECDYCELKEACAALAVCQTAMEEGK